MMPRILLVIGVVAMVGLGFLFSGFGAFAADVPSISVSTLEAKLEGQNPPLLLDVREPSETAFGVIKGATLIPLGDLQSRMAELPKDRLIVVYCRSGNRSLRAASILKSGGFTLVENLDGGINAWYSQCSSDKRFC